MSDSFRCQGRVVRETDKAVMVSLTMGLWQIRELWVPRSVLQPDNALNWAGDTGEFAVALWWAVQNKLEQRLAIRTSSLAVQQTVDGILQVIGLQADAIAREADVPDALCECGRCEGNPIKWHQVEALVMLKRLLCERLA